MSLPYSSLILRIEEGTPPITYDDLTSPHTTYPTTILISDDGGVGTINPTIIGGALANAIASGGGT